MSTVQSQGVFPVAPESQRAYRFISDDEAKQHGLPMEITEADKLRAELAQLKSKIAAGTVLDQGIRSLPPVVVDEPPAPPPVVVPWDSLPLKTRQELEAGRLHSGGGLSARQAYERSQGRSSTREGAPPPEPLMIMAPPEPEQLQLPFSDATRRELQAGRDLITVNDGVVEYAAGNATRAAFDRLVRHDRPTGDELHYSAPQDHWGQ